MTFHPDLLKEHGSILHIVFHQRSYYFYTDVYEFPYQIARRCILFSNPTANIYDVFVKQKELTKYDFLEACKLFQTSKNINITIASITPLQFFSFLTLSGWHNYSFDQVIEAAQIVYNLGKTRKMLTTDINKIFTIYLDEQL